MWNHTAKNYVEFTSGRVDFDVSTVVGDYSNGTIPLPILSNYGRFIYDNMIFYKLNVAENHEQNCVDTDPCETRVSKAI